MVNSFRKSLMYRAAPRWSSAFMRSQPNKSTGPLCGLGANRGKAIAQTAGFNKDYTSLPAGTGL